MTEKKHNAYVRQARIRLALSQVEFAKALGLSRKTIGRYENGGLVPERSRLAIKQLLIEKTENPWPSPSSLQSKSKK